MPSTPIPVSGVLLIPAHHGCVLPAFVCLPNSSSTSNTLWRFIQVIFFDPEAQRDHPLLQTLIKHLWGLCCTLQWGKVGKKWAKVFLKAPHLISKINPGTNYIIFSLFFFFFSTVVTTSTRLKNLLKSPGLFRHGSGMILMSSGLQIPSHLQQVMHFSFIPTVLPLV